MRSCGVLTTTKLEEGHQTEIYNMIHFPEAESPLLMNREQ